MPTVTPNRSVTHAEALLAAFFGLRSVVADVRASALTITPSTGKKIVVKSLLLQTDSTTAMTVAIASTGVSTSTVRTSTAAPTLQSTDAFVGADGQTVTFTPAGYTAGTYAELRVTYYEI